MGSLGCCFWWLIFGALIGWLAHCWLRRSCCKPADNKPAHVAPPAPPVAKVADVPATSIAPAPEVKAPPTAATVLAKPKAAPKAKAPAKPKAAPKAKAEPKAKAAPKAKAPVKPKASAKPKGADVALAKAAGFALKNPNDLTVIEGIGPKINELFTANGLETFAKVAKASVPQMRAILEKGGPRFRIANPSTWAKQAALADSNKWAELKKLQDELSGGVKK